MIDQNIKYPIGKFSKPKYIQPKDLNNWLEIIRSFPKALVDEITTMPEHSLDTPYRDGGWTARQVVHHCADSHINAFVRFKLTLTEDNPVIKPYNESLWAELNDSKYLPVESSLSIISGLHIRWYNILKSMDENMFKRYYIHPETNSKVTLEEALGICLAL